MIALIAVSAVSLLQTASVGAAQADAARAARSAQARFESLRRAHLPRRAREPRQSCHAIIGRYCFWYDPAEREPPAEPPEITRARGRLLELLDSALAVHPADDWMQGQRTRYLIDAGRFADAIAAARSCLPDGWWCEALRGLALHEAERYAEAEAAFDTALRSMTPERRCAWTDVRDLVNRALARAIGADCGSAQRERTTAMLWTVADPAWTSPANEARTEHLARQTMAGIQSRAASPHGMRFGDDSRELMVRYGWSEWFTQDDRRSATVTSAFPAVTGHGREPSFALFPDVATPRAIERIEERVWDFTDSLARSRFAPRNVKGLRPLPHQLARLARGDSIEIVAAYVANDTGMARDTLLGAISAKWRDEGRTVSAIRTSARRGVVRMRVPRDTVIVSIEVHGAPSRRLARARYTIDPLPCTGGCISDLLLFDATDGSRPGGDPVQLDSVLPRALTAGRVSARLPLGVYWEMDLPATAATAEISVLVTPVAVGRLRRLATQLRLARAQSPIRLGWSATRRGRHEAQSVVLRLPDGARGRYNVVLTVDTSDGTSLTRSREIEVGP